MMTSVNAKFDEAYAAIVYISQVVGKPNMIWRALISLWYSDLGIYLLRKVEIEQEREMRNLY